MSVSSIATFGSAAIATPPPDANAVKRDDQPAERVQPVADAAKAPGTGRSVDRSA